MFQRAGSKSEALDAGNNIWDLFFINASPLSEFDRLQYLLSGKVTFHLTFTALESLVSFRPTGLLRVNYFLVVWGTFVFFTLTELSKGFRESSTLKTDTLSCFTISFRVDNQVLWCIYHGSLLLVRGVTSVQRYGGGLAIAVTGFTCWPIPNPGAHDVNPSVFANGGKLSGLNFHVLKLPEWFHWSERLSNSQLFVSPAEGQMPAISPAFAFMAPSALIRADEIDFLGF